MRLMFLLKQRAWLRCHFPVPDRRIGGQDCCAGLHGAFASHSARSDWRAVGRSRRWSGCRWGGPDQSNAKQAGVCEGCERGRMGLGAEMPVCTCTQCFDRLSGNDRLTLFAKVRNASGRGSCTEMVCLLPVFIQVCFVHVSSSSGRNAVKADSRRIR